MSQQIEQVFEEKAFKSEEMSGAILMNDVYYR